MKIWMNMKIYMEKSLMKYHCIKKKDFCINSNMLLLNDVFENLRKMCWKIYELDPAKCFSTPGLA